MNSCVAGVPGSSLAVRSSRVEDVADAVDVNELTSQLYTSEPADFVRVRTEGARALKSAGQADAAAAFAKLAKPSVPAWVVNVLAGQRPAVIDDVIARGDELR